MIRINGVSYPGVTVERSGDKDILSIRINLRRCGEEVRKMLAKAGLVQDEPHYDPKFVRKIKSQEGTRGVKIKASDIWNSNF